MGNKGRSYRRSSGDFKIYDEKGNKHSARKDIFGNGYTIKDSRSNKEYRVEKDLWGGYVVKDKRGNKAGSIRVGSDGTLRHYDKKGNRTGTSYKRSDGYRHSDSTECYVATCVYGSRDCSQVVTLRRWRDTALSAHVPGRAFIRFYYAVSPTLVRWFGGQRWFHRLCKPPIDRLVRWLEAKN